MLGRIIARRFSTTVARKSEIHQHGLPGAHDKSTEHVAPTSAIAMLCDNIQKGDMWKLESRLEEFQSGLNLPFDIHNRYKLTALFTIFFTSAFSLPFIVVRHQILKK